jgi:hypothetical protein
VKIVNASGDQPRSLDGAGSTMHAMLVIGFSQDGSGVIVNDPWSGKELTIPLDTFQKMWDKGKGGMVYIHP